MQPSQPYGSPAFPPAQAPAPKKKTNWALIGGVGCLSLVVVCCVFPVGGFFGGNAIASGDVEDAVTDFAAAGRAQNADGVYAMLDSYSRSNVDRARLPEAMSRCTGLTTNTSVTIVDTSIDHPFDNFMIASVRYETPTGPIEGSIGIEREDDGFKIGTYSEHSPAQGYGYCTLRTTTYGYGY
jgi:hypothetical protein